MTEDQLRDQLRRVDDLTPPPAPDFAARAMRESARHADRRRTWGKGLLGVAAAVAIGTLAVTNLPRSTNSGSSAASGVAPEVAKDGQTPVVEGDTAASGPTPTATATGMGRLFTAAECATTLTGVDTALPMLKQQGLPVISAACDARGVVVVRMGTALTPEQRGVLTARYGARVSVADRDGTPLP